MSKGKIIVVDDEGVIVRMTIQMLEKIGFSNVVGFSLPGEALDAIEKLHHDGQKLVLLITDIVMPRMIGTELAHNARQLWPGIPIVFMTGACRRIQLRHKLPDFGKFFQKNFGLY